MFCRISRKVTNESKFYIAIELPKSESMYVHLRKRQTFQISQKLRDYKMNTFDLIQNKVHTYNQRSSGLIYLLQRFVVFYRDKISFVLGVTSIFT